MVFPRTKGGERGKTKNQKKKLNNKNLGEEKKRKRNFLDPLPNWGHTQTKKREVKNS